MIYVCMHVKFSYYNIEEGGKLRCLAVCQPGGRGGWHTRNSPRKVCLPALCQPFCIVISEIMMEIEEIDIDVMRVLAIATERERERESKERARGRYIGR